MNVGLLQWGVLVGGLLSVTACTKDGDPMYPRGSHYKHRIGETETVSGEVGAVRGYAPPPLDASQPSPAQQRAGGPETFAFDCGGGRVIVAQVDDRFVYLFSKDDVRALPRVTSENGSPLYYNGNERMVLSGESALIDLESGERLECRNDRTEAAYEAARLRGAEFRGEGEDPPFVIEIDSDSIVIATSAYDQARYVLPKSEPSIDEAAGTRVYTAKQGDMLFSVKIESGTCKAEDGEVTQSSVRIDAYDTSYEGCGRELSQIGPTLEDATP